MNNDLAPSEYAADEFLSLAANSRQTGRALYEAYISAEPSQDWNVDTSGVLHLNDHGSVQITPQGDIFGRHDEVNGLLKDWGETGKRTQAGTEPTMEAHHLIPASVLEKAGIAPNEGPCVGLWWSEHTHSIHGNVPAPDSVSSANDLGQYYSNAYQELGLPEWGKQVESFVQANEQRIDQNLNVKSAETRADGVNESLAQAASQGSGLNAKNVAEAASLAETAAGGPGTVQAMDAAQAVGAKAAEASGQSVSPPTPGTGKQQAPSQTASPTAGQSTTVEGEAQLGGRDAKGATESEPTKEDIARPKGETLLPQPEKEQSGEKEEYGYGYGYL